MAAVDTVRAVGIVKTTRAGRYLDQMISHFGHRAETERDGNRAVIRFEGGTLTATAGTEALALEIASSDKAQIAGLQEVVKSHLERWGVRDALVVEWEPGQ